MKKCLIFLSLLLFCFGAAAEGLSLSGCAYVDANQNAVCDAGEQLMSGVPIVLEGNGQSWQTTTDAYGHYAFEGLAAGEYRVLCSLNGQSMAVSSVGDATAYEDGFAVLDAVLTSSPITADIGLIPAASISVSVYNDANGNGTRGKSEKGLAGVEISLMRGEQVHASAITAKDGSASFTAAPGEYELRYTLPEGYGFLTWAQEMRTASEPVELSLSTPAEVSVPAQAVAFFSGMAFEDINNNGVMDDDEPGVAGVTVHLVGQKSGVKRSITTDESGVYIFDFLPNDRYTVTADLPDGMLYARYSSSGGDKRSIFTGETLEREFNVKSSASVSNKNIGVVQKGAVTGTAFFDLNYNGRWDEGEPGYAGVTVEAIRLSSGESMGKTVTDKNGLYRLENLRGGDYRVRAILPDDGAVFSTVSGAEPEQGNLFAQRASSREASIQPVSIASGGEAAVLIGVARGASISGTVFQDADYNGRMGSGEKAFSGTKVRLVNDQGEVVATDTTGKKGNYVLEGIMPGTYTLEVMRKDGYGFTRLRPEEQGGNHISALVGNWGVTEPMEIAMAQEIKDVNAGMLPSATVSGHFFHDVNDNGVWDAGELGMLSAKVRLWSEDGEIDLYQTPADDGSFFFDGVMPGKYTLSYLLPEHCEMVAKGSTTREFKVSMGDEILCETAGAVTLGSFEGIAFNDRNANGIQEADEPGLAGLSIAFDGMEPVVTAADGHFLIVGLRPGDANMQLTLPDGYIFSANLDNLILDTASSQFLVCPWQNLIDRKPKAIGAVKPASMIGEVWMDENQDGVQAENEWIVEGLTLSLIDESTGQVVGTTTSNADGFRFEAVRPGAYTVRFDLPEQAASANASASTFYQKGTAMVQSGIVVREGEQVQGLSTGLVSRTSLGGTAWLDERGQRSPVPGATVQLMQNGSVLQTATTAEDGSYRFDGLWPGEYSVMASLPDGMVYSRTNENGQIDGIRLLMAQHRLDQEILYIKPAKVGDIAWLDENQNGLLDGSEARLSCVTVRLLQNGQMVYETTTDEYGYYQFADVYPGEYVLEASAYPQLSPTTPVEALRIISSCLTSGDGMSASSEPFSVESGSVNSNFDLGYILNDGETLPEEAIADAPGRDWTESHKNVGIFYN